MSTCCIHCDAVLNAQDRNEGWCDSCGKKLPAGKQRTWKRPLQVATAPPAPEPGLPWYLSLAVGVILLVAGFFAFTILGGERAGTAFLAKVGAKVAIVLVIAVVVVVFRLFFAGVRMLFRG